MIGKLLSYRLKNYLFGFFIYFRYEIIILIVMAVATAAYLKMLRSYKTQSRVSQSYMTNLTGVEMLRYDLQMAGFGLPVSITPGASFSEAVDPGVGVRPTYYAPSSLNDANPNPIRAPHPIAILNNTGANNSDVLAIKSSMAGINPVSRKWSLIAWNANSNNGKPQIKRWGTGSLDQDRDFYPVLRMVRGELPFSKDDNG